MLAISLIPTANFVSVFRPEEINYHKYSAVLAVIEPLKVEWDSEIKKKINPILMLFYKIKGFKFDFDNISSFSLVK